VEAILLLVSPMVPHIAEELWQALGHTTLTLDVPWPQPQAEALTVSALTVVIQVNGKVRSRMVVPATASDEEIKNWALNDPAIEKWLQGQPPKKVILARRKLVSIVV
jgi:leucyl-tRNA synthetase